MLPSEVIGVAALTRFIKDLLEEHPNLRLLRVRGEITNARTYASGHWYFNLREGEAILRCVLFRSQAQLLTYLPRDGDEAIASGSLGVYERDGVYQLYVEHLQPLGDGALRQQFERLKEKLEREGLFDQRRKRPLPLRPRCIAVVTSPHGAVWHDIQTILRRRYPYVHLLLAPARVQGDDAVETLIAALESVQLDGRAEVVIIARGGGSLEDLWCFNDERLARAIYASRIPGRVSHRSRDGLDDLRLRRRPSCTDTVSGCRTGHAARSSYPGQATRRFGRAAGSAGHTPAGAYA
jgi:exodeoxyribonuclease VII large subunit